MCASASLNNTQFYKSFGANPSLGVRGVFLNISAAFDRVWHDGPLYKLKLLGICGRYYNLIQSFLDSRGQRVVLNGQLSKWFLAEAGVSEGHSSKIACTTRVDEYGRVFEALNFGCNIMKVIISTTLSSEILK